MTYEIQYTETALNHLKKLPKATSKRILDKLSFFKNSESPLQYAKKIQDHQLGNYRFRVGNYRIIFDIDKQGHIQILLILAVKHRKEAYL